MNSYLLTILLWLVLGIPAPNDLLSTRAHAQTTLQDHIRAFAATPELAGATITFDAVDLATGRSVAAHNREIAAIPASVQKLITTAVAFDVLGADHRFRTRLMMTGEVDAAGVLNGDVHLVGGGDPSLGSPYLEGVPRLPALLDRWRAALTKAGVRRINGRVIGRGTYFGTDGAAPGWPWSDLGNYYGSGAYGLNVHENFYFLDLLQRGQLGTTPPVQGTRPEIPGLQLTNELRSAERGSGDQAYIYGAPFGYDNYVRGTIPVGSGRFTIKGAIPDPPLFAAQALRRHLIDNGLPVALPAASAARLGADASGGRILDEYLSPPLTELAGRVNLRSNNLYAEALLRAVNKARGVPTAELATTTVVTDWLEARGLPLTAVRLEDGSGLATRNFFPAAFMTAFLRDQAGNKRWRATLPVAGRSGSMRRFLAGTAADGRLAAKSGSLGAVRAYAGYADRPDGRRLAYHLAVNNFTGESKDLRARMHRLLLALVTAPLAE